MLDFLLLRPEDKRAVAAATARTPCATWCWTSCTPTTAPRAPTWPASSAASRRAWACRGRSLSRWAPRPRWSASRATRSTALTTLCQPDLRGGLSSRRRVIGEERVSLVSSCPTAATLVSIFPAITPRLQRAGWREPRMTTYSDNRVLWFGRTCDPFASGRGLADALRSYARCWPAAGDSVTSLAGTVGRGWPAGIRTSLPCDRRDQQALHCAVLPGPDRPTHRARGKHRLAPDLGTGDGGAPLG